MLTRYMMALPSEVLETEGWRIISIGYGNYAICGVVSVKSYRKVGAHIEWKRCYAPLWPHRFLYCCSTRHLRQVWCDMTRCQCELTCTRIYLDNQSNSWNSMSGVFNGGRWHLNYHTSKCTVHAAHLLHCRKLVMLVGALSRLRFPTASESKENKANGC